MDPSQWGVDEAFKTLESITEGSSAAKGALRFLRHEITRLREDCSRWESARNVWMAEEKRLKAQVEELSIHAEKWVKRATTPAHEREPPHCSSCACPPYQAPEPPAEPDELMQWVEHWAEAYPLDMFPKPDLYKARDVLSAAGLSLDCISADAMRHVITRVRDRMRAAQPPGDGQ